MIINNNLINFSTHIELKKREISKYINNEVDVYITKIYVRCQEKSMFRSNYFIIFTTRQLWHCLHSYTNDASVQLNVC